ncbi:uncharacterized protein N7515_010296 [Penicillium bovifimosum]|uniref:C2H2 type master regulator of conidiophore development brlA n=1 Tax=Penicillium bovifimosum TaxID=126998 RepID=A0A9W9KVA9_9EURO|nr:uncharacterized protein N7515_010296 [Penicillium bovifimosum]KAJ5120908.1 hypothetical protein N7515_010296 [Penicillium bovifimosum]
MRRKFFSNEFIPNPRPSSQPPSISSHLKHTLTLRGYTVSRNIRLLVSRLNFGISGGISPIGLGIALDNTFGQLRAFPPATTLPSQLIPETPTPAFALPYGDYSSGPCYQPVYNGLHTSPSDTPLGFYSPTPMSTSPSYNSTMGVGPDQHAFQGQMTDIWMHTPCSGPTTPSDALSVTRAGTVGQWGHSVFPNDCIPSSMATLSVNDPIYFETMESQIGYNGPSGQISNTGQFVAPPQQATGEGMATGEGIPEDITMMIKREVSPDKWVSASGLKCPKCGAMFTRRSNCKEHQKMHNPQWKHNHPCDDCPKTFGRSSDLKRHMKTVHLGHRKYSCDSCDARFSRQDSLARHMCADKTRNGKSTGRDGPSSLGREPRQRSSNHSLSAGQ